ncbi:MFS transporter [Nonomuraea sp. NPDC050663]|uniref:MFS transporter n=1 Tax=Nonomuraea sp. NPDC050663 TaxID=3364370 RepID=UPI003791DA99
MTEPRPTLRGNRGFRLLLASDAVSQAGTQVTVVAVPLIAVITLGAGPLETGLLGAAQTAAPLLIGLQAGVWADRLRRRPIMIGADLVRAALLLTLPLAWWLQVLTLSHLLVVALGMSAATVFFDVAFRSYLPAVVEREQLVAGNGAVETVAGVARVSGPGLGGLLVQWLGPPVAVIVDTVSFLLSALLLRAIDVEEHPQAGPRPRIREGLAFLLGRPVVRAPVFAATVCNFWALGIVAVLPVFMINEVGVSAAVFGTLLIAAAAGGLVGGVLAAPLARRVGQARLVWVSMAASLPFSLLLPLTAPGWGLAWFVAAFFMPNLGVAVFNIAQLSYRQAVTPDRLLGRTTAAVRFLAWGSMPLGALAGGALAELYGTATAILICAVGQLLALAPLLASPLRVMRDYPGDGEAPRA